MFWLAVRADGIGSDGVTVGCGLAVADPAAVPDDAVPDAPWAPDGLVSGEGVTTVAGGEPGVLADGVADALADAPVGNSDLLAGTSLRKDRKIWLSCGWFHSTLAVSVGTT